MNIGRSEYTRLIQIEVKYRKIIELYKWIDECLETLADLTVDDDSNAYYDAINVLDEAYTEFQKYLQELTS